MAEQRKLTIAKDKTPVWIHCRARKTCPGNMAEPVFDQESPGGGGIVKRYRCLTCKGTFHITVGSQFKG